MMTVMLAIQHHSLSTMLGEYIYIYFDDLNVCKILEVVLPDIIPTYIFHNVGKTGHFSAKHLETHG